MTTSSEIWSSIYAIDKVMYYISVYACLYSIAPEGVNDEGMKMPRLYMTT